MSCSGIISLSNYLTALLSSLQVCVCMLQCVAVCCSVLQCVAVCSMSCTGIISLSNHLTAQLSSVQVFVCVLQSIAVFCSVFHELHWNHISVKFSDSATVVAPGLRVCFAVCCSVLQCVAVCSMSCTGIISLSNYSTALLSSVQVCFCSSDTYVRQ